MMLEGRRIAIRGVVQGVGFRPWVYRLAQEEGIAGRVRNDGSGVTIEAFGFESALDAFLQRLESTPPPAANIRALQWEAIPPEPAREFVILGSARAEERLLSIPPDLATCPQCLSEISDPRNRRYRYPFTNCTNCGPRFTIAREVPYDRTATTMAPFQMCPQCQREYRLPTDRRFHAEPNACPLCGPQLRVLTAKGIDIGAEDAIRTARRALDAGLIVAIKGIGGFHLACDATSGVAVRRLRALKHRDEKPFAVMVRNIAAAERLAWIDETERDLLTATERPIVLVRRRNGGVAEEVAPHNPLLGVLLPYAPLHHVLLGEMDRPLVMTSGNMAEEPIAYRNEEALARLGGVADLFVLHDREIETRCDDSVARVIAGRPVVLRRSRGYVPRAIAVPSGFDRPILACGAHLKNTFCIGAGESAHLGPHIGDLENLETREAFEEAIERMQRFLGVRPEIIAHDLHPQYLSTRYAQGRPEAVKIGVQHHHAHVASAMAEHGLEGPVLGLVYDGTGYGTDGTAWGGELLLADYEGFRRLATFRPLRLAGADAAIRQPWRSALALLEDAFAGDPPLEALPLFRSVPQKDLTVVRQMIVQQVNAPLAHGVGRYFDALGALVLNRRESRYEGQTALELNLVADANERGQYAYELHTETQPWTIDLRPLAREAVSDLTARLPVAGISAKFHNTLIAASAAVVRAAARETGKMPVVLTGGCFQNARLAEGVLAALGDEFSVYLHSVVPPGDGGIALGQALVADAVVRRRSRGESDICTQARPCGAVASGTPTCV